MRYLLYLILFSFGLILYSSCGVSGQLKGDYTLNQSRLAETESKTEEKEDLSLNSKRQAVIGDARRLVGKGYRYGSCGPNAFDCSGFTQYVYSKNGISLPRSSSEQARVGQGIQMDKIQGGDLVVFSKSSNVSHVGICIENDQDGLWVAHSTTSRGVVLENVLDSQYWSRRVRDGRLVIR